MRFILTPKEETYIIAITRCIELKELNNLKGYREIRIYSINLHNDINIILTSLSSAGAGHAPPPKDDFGEGDAPPPDFFSVIRV